MRLENGENIEIGLFDTRYTIELISRELLTYRDFDFEDTTPEQELRIYKAYLIIVSEIDEKEKILLSKEIAGNDIHGIKHLLWPHFIKQFEFKHRANPILEGIKALSFLQFCQKDNILKDCLNTFLLKTDSRNFEDYVAKILSIVNLSFNLNADQPFNNLPVIRVTNTDLLFQNLSMQPEDIQKYEEHKKDYLGIKSKPIFKLSDDNYIITNWNYLYNTLFSGLVFSFYKYSDAIKPFKDFSNYKSHIGTGFSHNVFFQGIIKGCFPNADCLWFGNHNDGFNPDCYYRKGKCIFIIEFKDNLINKDVIHSDDFEVIKNDIDKKFISSNNRNKGILQIKTNLEYLKNNPPEFDSIFKKEKIRNFKIYPIIIHTNFYFALPGINEYVNEKFSTETSHLKNSFKPLKPLTIIDIDFFIDYIIHFKTNAICLENTIEKYINEVIARKNKINKETQTEYDKINTMFSSMASFDEVMSKKHTQFPQVDNSAFLKELYSCLGISPNRIDET